MNKPNIPILFVWNRMGDYHFARTAQVEKLIGSDYVFTADLAASDNLYLWNTKNDNKHHILLSKKNINKSDTLRRIINFIHVLKKHRIKACGLAGYGRIEYLLMIIICKLAGIKTAVFTESWYENNRIISKAKAVFLKIFVNKYMASGIKARNYLINSLNIHPDQIITGYSTVDNQHFSVAHSVKTKTLLCIARFSTEKNLLLLTEAFISSDLIHTHQLKIAGDGQLSHQLKTIAAQYPQIIIEPWTNYNQLPALYKSASVFILPSKFEPWGLVVNEAMAAGLPVIVSDACGCAPDLVSADNGFVFNANSKESLISVLNKVAQLPEEQLSGMGNHSLQIIRNFDTAVWAQNFLNLLNK